MKFLVGCLGCGGVCFLILLVIGVAANNAKKLEKGNPVQAEKPAKKLDKKADKVASAPQPESEADRLIRIENEMREKNQAERERQQAENEYEQDGLVLLNDSLKMSGEGVGRAITGIVINRRKNKLTYAQITFNLYDASGDQVGSASANVNGLEPGGRWKFQAATFGQGFAKSKVSEITGY